MARQAHLAPGTEQARKMAAQWFTRGRDVFGKGDYDYAVKAFKEACKLDPYQAMYRQLLRLAARKKWGDNKRGSRMAAVTTMKARAALKAAKAKRQFLRALECCEDVLSENPWDSGTLLEMAAIFDQLDQIALAVWSAELAMEKDPADPTVNRALAGYYERQGQFAKAIDCWERVKKARPEDQDADRKLKSLAASATIDKGGYGQAQSFTQAIADREKTQELLDEAKGGVGEERLSHQVQQLRRRIDREPSEVGPYVQLSMLYRRHGKYAEAKRVAEQALQATDSHPDAVTEAENVEMARLAAETEAARKQAAANPDDAQLQGQVRQLAQRQNQFELDCFRRRSQRNPADLGLRVELGIRLAKARHFDQAIGELQKARSEPRRKAEVLFWIGRCFHAKKNVRMAKRHYEQALEALPETEEQSLKELHYLLGRVCEDTGDHPAAIEHYEQVAEMDYGYRDVAKRLDALTVGEGESTSEVSDLPDG